MEPLTFDYEDLHVRVDRGVFELFPLRGSDMPHTLRVPLHRLGVLVHYKKPNKPGDLIFGVVGDPKAALYGTDLAAFGYSSTTAARVPRSDEPLFRAYFTEVAALADRQAV
ncbi:hypothetical protein ACFFS2_29615 [Streptomyces aurantiacus]|uniref:Uncharacterized protein n=1 Tax=Streptomyces aurantiacus TaxID=47760 RepID=A0A7G1PGE1_9ACTN|nr:hypothetical protein [Streptomyces aurantiacus]BCL33364.1 hypothetical protein GCM10017557_82230 [Streptomyces aurantiacus]